MRRVLPVLLTLFLGTASAADDAAETEEQMRRFAELYAVVEEHAAEPVIPPVAIYGGAIPGMLKRLDPHSIFFDPDQFQQLQELQESTRKGFGSVVSVLPGRVFVLQTLPGTPSARAGMMPGDEILAINGIRLDRLSFEQLVELLNFARQRPVKLDVRRPGAARLLQVEMRPETLDSPSVDLAYFIRAGVGYVRATSFESDTGQQIRDAIEKLGGDHLKALVLDLRDNPGGVMTAALEAAAHFLEPGQTIVSVRGRSTETEEIKVPGDSKPYRFPVAVLVNDRSASGSEIVAGALQDHDRAAIIGTESFGKGLVQGVFPLSEGTGLALTTAYYYTPSGRSIQRPLTAGQLESARHAGGANEYRTDSGRPVPGGGGIQPDYTVYPEPVTPLMMVLEASGVFPAFAAETLRKRGPVEDGFEVGNALLDEFQAYLADRRIQPGVERWSATREWIRSRLTQEIYNQAFGIAQGDAVQLERDPQVRKALEVLDAG